MNKTEICKDTPVYSISSAARLLGISVHTLRMYERESLIIPYKEENKNRLYSQRDIERVECIKDKIKGKKFSINAIKAIMSLIPCWSVINCPAEDRLACPAYTTASAPCWSFKHEGNICEGKECRGCEVYRNIECENIKEAIKISSENICN